MPDPADLLSAIGLYLERRGNDIPARFLDGLCRPMPRRTLSPRPLPCLAFLPAAVAAAAGAHQPLAACLAAAAGHLAWGQTYTAADFGAAFLDGYGWVELCGSRGHFANDSIAAGFLLLGPRLTYPDHHHVAEEIYVPLTSGTAWRMGDTPYADRAAGTVIHHRSEVSHAMRTGDVPLLALYVWRGGPLDQRSEIGTTATQRNG